MLKFEQGDQRDVSSNSAIMKCKTHTLLLLIL